jgi:hypothetical protein
MTNQECVYYRLRVYEDKKKVTGGPNFPGGFFTGFILFGYCGALWDRAYEVGADDSRTVYSRRSLVDEEDDIPLVIEDDTGLVEVDLRGATILAKDTSRMTSGDNRPPPSHLEELLREEHDIHTVDSRGFFKDLHFIEEVLPIGAKVTVVGPVEELKTGDLCFRKQDALLLVSERGLDKEIEAARGRAFGGFVGAGSALAVGLFFFLSAVFVVVRAMLA